MSFEAHIRTLFRHSDRQSMKFAFDLWAYDDVKHNAHAILERLRDGSMPCDSSITRATSAPTTGPTRSSQPRPSGRWVSRA